MQNIINHIKYHIFNEFGIYSGIVFEKNGVFSNFKELISFVTDEIIMNKSKIIDCMQFNTFFNCLHINYMKSNELFGAYDKYELNDVFIDLSIYDNYENYFELENIILHELLHAYEDYNRLSKNKKSINYYITHAHIKSQLNLNNRNEVISLLSKCIYFLNDKEQRAYFSTLENTIEKIINDKKIRLSNLDIKFICDEIFKTGIWKEYYKIKLFLDEIENIFDKNLFVNVYNSMYKTNKSFQQIVKIFKKQWKKFDSKFNQLVPKIICDNIKINKGF